MAEGDAVIKALQAALETPPDNTDLRKHLADLLAERGDYAEGEKEYRQVLAKVPSDEKVKLALAGCFCGQSKWELAQVVLEEMMRSGSTFAEVFLLATRAYIETANMVEASTAYQKAIQLDPPPSLTRISNRAWY